MSSKTGKFSLMSHHEQYSVGQTTTGGLSVFFTILCIVDLFGVFPLVALPSAVIACGFYSIPLLVLVFGLQVYTAVLLGRCWLLAKALQPEIGAKSRYPYAAVAELACGPRTRRIVTFLLDATVFGAGIPNLLVASQNLHQFSWKMSSGAVDISFCLWLLVIGLLLCPVMWLGSPKDMKSLAMVSVCIVMTVAALIWCCVLTDNTNRASDNNFREHQPAVKDLLLAYGIIAFQFDVHPMLLTIQVDMKDSAKINMAVVGGFLVTGAMFAVTSALAAVRYGHDVQSNILEGIPASVPLYVVSLLVTLQLCLSSAVGNSALFQHLEHLLRISRDFSVQRCMLRSSIVALAVFLAEAVPRFDLVMGLVGSTLTGPLMFIFPPLFYIKLSRMQNSPQFLTSRADITLKNSLSLKEIQNGDCSQNGQLSNLNLERPSNYKTFNNEVYREVEKSVLFSKSDLVMPSAVMLFGVAATVSATYSSWSGTINYAKFKMPCLVNATVAASNYFESKN